MSAVVRVDSALGPYDVTISSGALAALPGLVEDASRVAVIHPAPLAPLAERVAALVGRPATLIPVPDAEAAKTPQVLADCWDALAAAGFTRNDMVIGVGGGTTTDLAGFVAASWLRGVDYVSVPTSVLAMVDAAVGGKTGINLPAGKNLVGAFYEPKAVLCDLSLLGSLAPEEVASGLAEVVKCGFIADQAILDLAVEDLADCGDVTSARFAELVTRAVAVKARVVAADFTESTSKGSAVGREVLNYGHTLGHAIENAERYQWRHGAAVSVGMVFAAELARLAGKLSDDDVARHRSVLSSLGLPLTYRGDRWDALLGAMRRDKKSRGDLLRFVVLDSLGHPTRLEGPDPTLLAAAYAEVSEDAPAGGRPVSL